MASLICPCCMTDGVTAMRFGVGVAVPGGGEYLIVQ